MERSRSMGLFLYKRENYFVSWGVVVFSCLFHYNKITAETYSIIVLYRFIAYFGCEYTSYHSILNVIYHVMYMLYLPQDAVFRDFCIDLIIVLDLYSESGMGTYTIKNPAHYYTESVYNPHTGKLLNGN